MYPLHLRRRALSLLVCSLLPLSALAEGQIEINQASVVAGGGFPVTLGTTGSYVLTSNLTVPNANTTAIVISADDVSLDLGGFAIVGVTSCSYANDGSGDEDTSCTGTGSGHGIRISGSRAAIRNGTIRGMGAEGITDALGGPGAIIERVTVTENGGDGVTIFEHGLVTSCRAIRNGNKGISVGHYSVVSGNLAVQNGNDGIRAGGSGAVVQGNLAAENGLMGIRAQGSAVVTQNTANDNDGTGISMSFTANYFGNTMNDNGTDASSGVDNGQNLCSGGAC